LPWRRAVAGTAQSMLPDARLPVDQCVSSTTPEPGKPTSLYLCAPRLCCSLCLAAAGVRRTTILYDVTLTHLQEYRAIGAWQLDVLWTFCGSIGVCVSFPGRCACVRALYQCYVEARSIFKRRETCESVICVLACCCAFGTSPTIVLFYYRSGTVERARLAKGQ
jgi:hypothetical protein